jgi:ketosteroid isomerase-like protein
MSAALLTDQLEASLGLAGRRSEDEIRYLIAGWEEALQSRNLSRLMAFYSGDVVLFDVQPPFRTAGLSAVRELWEESLPLFPEVFRIERRDLQIEAGSATAFAHWLFRLAECPSGHAAAQTWMRVSAGYRKRQGCWKIVHEHVSLPIDPTSLRAEIIPTLFTE